VDPADLRVLEVGCGSGYFLSRFLEYGARHASGIDLLESRVALARKRDPRLEVLAGDAAELPWDDASFDLVTQFTCLSSVLSPSLRQRIAAEMWRVLRPGGALLSYDMRVAPWPLRTIRRVALSLRERGDSIATTPTAPVESTELRSLFPEARFEFLSVTLGTDIAASAKRSPGLVRLFGAMPFLRTHLLAIARRDDSLTAGSHSG
jgi:SAM-dependent methyltransferase